MVKRQNQVHDAPPLQIKSGTYHGEQFVDNTEEIAVSEKGMVYSVRSDYEDPSRPDLVVEVELAPEDWEQLAQDLNLDAIGNLPDTVGQPDHSDQGAEWVYVQQGDFERTIRFEEGSAPAEIQKAVEKLRELRLEAGRKRGRKLP